MASTERRQRRIDEHRPLTTGGAIVPPGTTAAPPAGPGIGVPGAPQNVRILETFLLHGQGQGLAGANVVWTAPIGASPDRYLVQWDGDSSFTAPAGRIAFQTSIGLDGMPTGATIYVRVAALVGNVQGAWSATVSATTPSDTTVPAAPSNLTTSWNGQTGDLAISWTASTSTNVRDYRVRIYASNGGALLREAYTPAAFFIWTKGLHAADTGGAYDPSVYLVVTARSWGGIFSSDLTGTATLAPPATPTGLTTSWAGDTGTAGANCLISWTMSTAVAGYRLTIDGTARDVGLTGRYDYSFAQNQAEHAGTADPSLSLSLMAVDALGQVSNPAASTTATNAAPPSTTLTVFAGFSSVGLTITPSAALDLKDYRVRVYRGGSLVRTVYFTDTRPTYAVEDGDGDYTFDVAVRDLFNQVGAASAQTTAVTVTDLAGFIDELRSGAVYSDQLATNPETLFDAYTDDNRASGGISYASNASWVRWIRFERPERDRYRTITLSMTPTSGTTTWYIRTSEDGTTWNYYAGPVVSGRILTSVANAGAAQTAAVSAATLGGPSTSRVDLPAMVSARYVEVWLRNTAAATRVDEFYPRRLVQADDLEAEAIKAVHIGAGTITGDKLTATAIDGFTITGTTIRTAATGPRLEMSGSEFRAIDATPVIRVKIDTAGITTYDSFGNVQIEATTATDGALRAGAGSVTLDRSGLRMAALAAGAWGLSPERALTWRNGAVTTGSIGSAAITNAGATLNYTRIDSYASTQFGGQLFLTAQEGSGGALGGPGITISGGGGTSGATQSISIDARYGATNIVGGARIQAASAPGGAGHLTVEGGINVGSATGAGTGQIVTSGSVTGANVWSVGTTAAHWFSDRANTSLNWAWYAHTTARLWRDGIGDVLTVDGGGNIITNGTVTAAQFHSMNLHLLDSSGNAYHAGKIGIRTAVDSFIVLTVNGETGGSTRYGLAVRDSSSTNNFYVRDDGYCWSRGTMDVGGLNNRSDARLKIDVAPVSGALDTLLALQPRQFRWASDPDGPVHYGLIAQEAERVAPELVAEGQPGPGERLRDGERGILSVNLGSLVGLLLGSTHQIHDLIQQLTARVAALEVVQS